MAKTAAATDRDTLWLEHLRACGTGSMKDYAAAHELDVRALYEAKARLRRKGLLSSPAPLRPCRIQLPNGVSIELACAPGELAAVLAAAAALP